MKKLTLLAFFAVLALTVFVLESFIPMPFVVPGFKLGLANIITLFMLFLGGAWKARDVFLVLVTRVLLSAFITGNAVGLIYGFAGGISALLIMLLLKNAVKNLPVPVISVAGAIAHNAGQLSAAAFYFQSGSVFAYLPLLTAGGIISGLLTGFAVYFIYEKHPRFIRIIKE